MINRGDIKLELIYFVFSTFYSTISLKYAFGELEVSSCGKKELKSSEPFLATIIAITIVFGAVALVVVTVIVGAVVMEVLAQIYCCCCCC